MMIWVLSIAVGLLLAVIIMLPVTAILYTREEVRHTREATRALRAIQGAALGLCCECDACDERLTEMTGDAS